MLCCTCPTLVSVEVPGLDGENTASPAVVDATGRLLLQKGNRLTALSRRYDINVLGVGNLPTDFTGRPVVQTATELPLLRTFEDRVAGTDLYLNGKPAPFDLSVADENQRILLDPADLPQGIHALEVQVRYVDGSTVSRFVDFVSQPIADPTWSGFVEPLFAVRCATCHGIRAARELYLTDQWQADFENILDQLEQGLMPIPPVPKFSPAEVDLVKKWRDIGFPD